MHNAWSAHDSFFTKIAKPVNLQYAQDLLVLFSLFFSLYGTNINAHKLLCLKTSLVKVEYINSTALILVCYYGAHERLQSCEKK